MDCSEDWRLAIWNVSSSLDGNHENAGHPIYQFSWHEAFAACRVAGVILRLFHLLSVSPSFVLAVPFGQELWFLQTTDWPQLLASDFGFPLFRVLDRLSKRLCHQGQNDGIPCESGHLATASVAEQLQHASAEAPSDANLPPRCSLRDAMGLLAGALRLRDAGRPQWRDWVRAAQRTAGCAADGLGGLLLTGWRPYEVLQQLAMAPARPRRRRHAWAFMERLESPVQRVEAQWCGEWPRASARANEFLVAHALGATVHRTPAGRRVLEMALFFERLDVAKDDDRACESFIGSQWFRLQCAVAGGSASPASMLSGFTWMKPTKSNLVSCVLPPEASYPMVVDVDVLAAEGGFREPLRIELCAISGQPAGAAVCTEPLHGLHRSRAVSDLVEHHLKIGFQVDLYDADGTGADAFERWKHTGKLQYFPRFVATQLGARLGGAEAAGIHEPAAGCSLGFQEIHCLFRHRGRSRWVAPRLDPDEYFYTPRRSNVSSVVSVLEAFSDARHVFVPSLEFGGRPAVDRGRAVAERFLLRSSVVNPRWIVLSDPAHTMSSHVHTARPRPGAHDEVSRPVDAGLLRINHYLHMFGERNVSFIHPDRHRFQVLDKSILEWTPQYWHRSPRHTKT